MADTLNSGTPDLAEVERIAALADPVLRNLAITDSYHQLSRRFATRLGSGANWCTFATWASRQAGQTIRKEDLRQAVIHVLGARQQMISAVENLSLVARSKGTQSSPSRIWDSLLSAIDPNLAIDRSSEAVARGNLKVYAEIGWEFARFISACLDDPSPDPGHLAGFCDGLLPGEPPDGQDLLRQAFSLYYQALFAPDPQQQAELLLLANLKIGFHEQNRLQPEILAAINAAFIDASGLARSLAAAIFPGVRLFELSQWLSSRLTGRPTPFQAAVQKLDEALELSARQAVTGQMMEIALPGGIRLRLGIDLNAAYPASLRRLTYPELVDFMKEIDPAPDSLQGSGALDWGNLSDRMHFIAEMFRCYQEDLDLFDPPFTDKQAEAIRAGVIPGGL